MFSLIEIIKDQWEASEYHRSNYVSPEAIMLQVELKRAQAIKEYFADPWNRRQRRKYMRLYRQTPEHKNWFKQYMQKYRLKPSVKAREAASAKAYNAKEEVKKAKSEYNRAYWKLNYRPSERKLSDSSKAVAKRLKRKKMSECLTGRT